MCTPQIGSCGGGWGGGGLEHSSLGTSACNREDREQDSLGMDLCTSYTEQPANVERKKHGGTGTPDLKKQNTRYLKMSVFFCGEGSKFYQTIQME